MEKKQYFSRLWQLLLVFLKIGAFTFGGGYAMIPLIQKEVCDNKKWITQQDILDIIAIAESTPGPIAINSATFVGCKVAGVFGSALATLGVVFPSFVIIIAISFILSIFESNLYVQYAFMGIRAGVLALIIKALISMHKQCPKNVFAYIVACSAFLLACILKINIFFVLIGCAVSGLIYSIIMAWRTEK